ncbi:hypothetical protein EKK58_08215 [Candidatus Dependentiae bacterium]|nr:MAG: hypothetical protein EKK58_08215 [Candidatus Dependentiae bacterium]
MAKRPTLITSSTNYSNVNALNQNWQRIGEAFDNTLSRDGSTPNTMLADLDMNSNDVINAGTYYGQSINVDEAVVGGEVLNVAALTEAIETAETSAENAQGYARAAQGDVDALVTTTEAGVLAVGENQTFVVAADSALSLYRRDGSSATLLMADYRPNAPLVPLQAPAAPAIVTAQSALKSGGVPMKMILGTNYTSGNDGAAILNSAIPDIAAEGLMIIDHHGIDIRCNSPIRPVSDLHMVGNGKTRFIRAYAATGTGSATLSRSDFNVDTDRMRLSNLVFDTLSPDMTGVGLAWWGADVVIDRVRVLNFYSGQGMSFGGDRFRILHSEFYTTSNSTGTGPLRCLGGKDGLAIGILTRGGDDGGMQLVPVSGVSTAKRYGQSIINCWQIGGQVISSSAKMLVAAIATSQGGTNSFPGVIKDSGWIGVTGLGTNRVIVVENTEGDGTIPKQIDGIVASNIVAYGSLSPASKVEIGSSILSDINNGIGRVTFNNVVHRDIAADFGLDINAQGATVVLNGCVMQGERNAMRVRADNVSIDVSGSCEFHAASAGDTESDSHVINCTATATNMRLRLVGKTEISGIPTGRSGISVSGSGAVMSVDDLVANKASGATGTNAITSNANPTFKIGYVTGTSDNITTFGSGKIYKSNSPAVINAAVTNQSITYLDKGPVLVSTGTMAATRTWSMSAAGAVSGMLWKITRTGVSGDLTLNDVSSSTTLTTLSPGEWAEFVFDGTNWVMIQRGSLT